jgi:hypothetical protein
MVFGCPGSSNGGQNPIIKRLLVAPCGAGRAASGATVTRPAQPNAVPTAAPQSPDLTVWAACSGRGYTRAR